MFAYETLQIEVDNNVAIACLNRPQVLNALNKDTMKDLNDFFDKVEGENSINLVILTAKGKAFVAGADIKELKDMNSIEAQEYSRRGQELYSKIENLRKPVIAAINGYALGGGCELALACDIRIASKLAKFALPEVKLGIIPGYGGCVRLSRIVGIGKAKEIIFTGKIINSEEAYRIALVTKIVENEDLINEAKSLAAEILRNSKYSVKIAKDVINKSIDMPFELVLQYEALSFGLCFSNSDQKEGVSAFLEKREPNFD